VCSKIYLLPLGDVTGAPDTAVLCDLLSRWFWLEAVPMPPLPDKVLAAIERDEDGCSPPHRRPPSRCTPRGAALAPPRPAPPRPALPPPPRPPSAAAARQAAAA
jgi:hypothetical protein